VELPLGIVVLVGVVGVVAFAVWRSSPPWRRRIPGLILAGLGVALFGSQLPPTPERLVLGVALLIIWGGTGLALIAGRTWARGPGLVVAGVGFAVAGWVERRSDAWPNEASRSADRVLVDVFFLADGPHFSWLEVGLASMAFAVASAVAAAFLLRAGGPSWPRDR
jgi:hypothetical protein